MVIGTITILTHAVYLHWSAYHVIGWLGWRACVDVPSKQSTVARLTEHFATVIRCECVVFSLTCFTKVSVVYSIVCALLAFKWLSAWIMMASTVKFTSDESLGGKWKFVSLNASSCQSNVAAISHVAVDA